MDVLLAQGGPLAELAPVVVAALESVSAEFDRQLSTDLPPVSDLVRHVERYRGKMLRPTLVVLCGMAASGGKAPITREHHVLAAVCEMVHMATLVHDDVLDEADTRRKGFTVNRLRGNEAAVILGDYLIASAYHLCSTLSSQRAALMVGKASMVMCAGELLQLHHRQDFSLDEPTYFEIVERKTAELIATSCELGARASGASDNVANKLYRFGRDLGVAFQIQDDLLDLTGEEAVVGKSVGKDLEKGKLTLPLISFLSNASAAQRGEALRLLSEASRDSSAVRGEGAGTHRPAETGQDRAAARSLAKLLDDAGAITHAHDIAASLVQRAKESLATLPESSAKQALLVMADAVITRRS